MKKKLVKYIFIFLLCVFIVSFTLIVLASGEAHVNNFNDFETALMNQSINKIYIDSNIEFTKNIYSIPNRDLTVYGNADSGILINSKNYSIYGKQNTIYHNTFSLINAKIIASGIPGTLATDGRFFTGGNENGPNAHGWDFYAKDIFFQGARFIHLSNGILTFDGNNEIYTNCENAWVNHVIFKENSIYKSSNSATGDYGTFYFNNSDSFANGTATIEKNAKTFFNIGTYAQPVFTGNVYKINVEEKAVFDVNTIGHAIWFVAGSNVFYRVENPQFNVKSGAIVNINQTSASLILNANPSRNNANYNLYVPIYFAKSAYPEVEGLINIDEKATFKVSGKTNINSNFGVIRMGENSVIKINKPKNFDIKNYAINAPTITSNYFAHGITTNYENTNISVWEKTNVEDFYSDIPKKTYDNITAQTYIVGQNTNKNLSNDSNFNSEFIMEKFGRIAMLNNFYYNVIFESNGGTLVNPYDNIPDGDIISEPITPTKSGYKFLGWFKEISLKNKWQFDLDIVESDTILYAKWELDTFYTATPTEATSISSSTNTDFATSSPNTTIETTSTDFLTTDFTTSSPGISTETTSTDFLTTDFTTSSPGTSTETTSTDFLTTDFTTSSPGTSTETTSTDSLTTDFTTSSNDTSTETTSTDFLTTDFTTSSPGTSTETTSTDSLTTDFTTSSNGTSTETTSTDFLTTDFTTSSNGTSTETTSTDFLTTDFTTSSNDTSTKTTSTDSLTTDFTTSSNGSKTETVSTNFFTTSSNSSNVEVILTKSYTSNFITFTQTTTTTNFINTSLFTTVQLSSNNFLTDFRTSNFLTKLNTINSDDLSLINSLLNTSENTMNNIIKTENSKNNNLTLILDINDLSTLNKTDNLILTFNNVPISDLNTINSPQIALSENNEIDNISNDHIQKPNPNTNENNTNKKNIVTFFLCLNVFILLVTNVIKIKE